MIVGTLEAELALEGCFNLKEKRRVLQSLLHKLQHELHVSAAEIGDQELWNRATIGVACVSPHAGLADTILERVLAKIDGETEIEVLGVLREVIRTD